MGFKRQMTLNTSSSEGIILKQRKLSFWFEPHKN